MDELVPADGFPKVVAEGEKSREKELRRTSPVCFRDRTKPFVGGRSSE